MRLWVAVVFDTNFTANTMGVFSYIKKEVGCSFWKAEGAILRCRGFSDNYLILIILAQSGSTQNKLLDFRFGAAKNQKLENRNMLSGPRGITGFFRVSQGRNVTDFFNILHQHWKES